MARDSSSPRECLTLSMEPIAACQPPVASKRVLRRAPTGTFLACSSLAASAVLSQRDEVVPLCVRGMTITGPSWPGLHQRVFDVFSSRSYVKSFRVDSHLHVQLADTGADSVDMHVLTATKHGCFLQKLHYVLCFLGACLSLLWLLSCARVDGSSHS